MNNLVKNEIIKIVRKKSFYIILIVVLAYIVLSNVMYKYVYTSDYEYYDESYVENLKDRISSLNLDNQQDLDMYVNDKTELDTYELLKQYDKGTWQYKLILEKASSYLSEINTYTYKIKDEEALNEAKETYNKFTERLKANDWKGFVQDELDELKKSQEGLSENEKDQSTLIQIEVLEMRLKNEIAYGDDYKNAALSRYQQSQLEVNELSNKNNKSYEEEKAYQSAKEDAEKSRYAIEQGKDIYNTSDAREFLLNVFSKYELFIIITIGTNCRSNSK